MSIRSTDTPLFNQDFAKPHRCSRCKEDDLAKFTKNKSRRNGLCQYCKTCARIIAKEHEAKRPDHYQKVKKQAMTRWRNKDIERTRLRRRKSMAAWRKRNPGAVTFVRTKCVYGITKERYYEILASQDSRCAICRMTAKEAGCRHGRLVIDHNHTTNIVRGFLCNHCNSGIGYFRENPATLLNAIEYLKRHEG